MAQLTYISFLEESIELCVEYIKAYAEMVGLHEAALCLGALPIQGGL